MDSAGGVSSVAVPLFASGVVWIVLVPGFRGGACGLCAGGTKSSVSAFRCPVGVAFSVGVSGSRLLRRGFVGVDGANWEGWGGETGGAVDDLGHSLQRRYVSDTSLFL